MREQEVGAVLMVSPWLTPCADNSGYFSYVVDIFNASLYTPHPPPPATSNPLFPPQTSASPHPPHPRPAPPPSAGSLCTSDCGTCCCPGCHAVNGTCYLCSAGSYSTGCSDHLLSSCRACPAGFFCPQGAAQPYLPWSTLAAIIAYVAVLHLALACVFLRSKRLAAARAKRWFVAVMILGPLAWLLWQLQHRAVRPPQTPASSLHQPLLAEHHASAPPLDMTLQ
jgi:hypothetical protein